MEYHLMWAKDNLYTNLEGNYHLHTNLTILKMLRCRQEMKNRNSNPRDNYYLLHMYIMKWKSLQFETIHLQKSML